MGLYTSFCKITNLPILGEKYVYFAVDSRFNESIQKQLIGFGTYSFNDILPFRVFGEDDGYGFVENYQKVDSLEVFFNDLGINKEHGEIFPNEFELENSGIVKIHISKKIHDYVIQNAENLATKKGRKEILKAIELSKSYNSENLSYCSWVEKEAEKVSENPKETESIFSWCFSFLKTYKYLKDFSSEEIWESLVIREFLFSIGVLGQPGNQIDITSFGKDFYRGYVKVLSENVEEQLEEQLEEQHE